jgi:FAD/FMN-containing dehydrogenase
MKRTDGSDVSVDSSAIDDFSSNLGGKVLTASSDGYDEARVIWNAMIDKRPGLIVQCTNTDDVSKAVKFARSHGLLVSVRGGGHNIAGKSLSDGGMLVDLSGMTSVSVDAGAKTAVVGPGATLADLDTATQEHGLITPTGINSTTGIAGLTLGGGFGWTSRTLGLTIDNLLSAEMVTAEGEVVTASVSENADLFWGLRGGGGNFGVVTSFEFRLHEVGPEILSGLIVHPFSDAKSVLRQYNQYIANVPDEVTVWLVARLAPPLPFLPEEVHGTPVLVIAAMYTGDMTDGEEAFKPLRAIGNPIADVIGPTPFGGWQQAFDPLLTPGLRNYWKSHYFMELSEGWMDALIAAIDTLPGPHTEIFIGQLGGAVSRVAADATAFGDRSFKFVMNVHGRWENASEDDSVIGWCRGVYDSMAEYSTGGAYMNFLTEEESARVESVYGENYDRLVELKRKYDPTNFFRVNQNIVPS